MTVTYSGRAFNPAELDRIRELAAALPTRAAISRAICAELGWFKPDGGLKEMSCRVALLRMQRDGLLLLPPPRQGPSRPGPVPLTAASDRQTPITGSRGDLGPILLQPVASQPDRALWRELITRWHYLGYTRHAGAQIRYLAYDSQHRLLAALAFSGAAWKTAPRDRFLRWSPEQRSARLHLIVDNSRFLLLPWVKVRFLASSLLAQIARQLPQDWQRRYGYQPLVLETFVDSHRFSGTSYRAAGWLCLGETTGRGKYDRHRGRKQPERYVFIRPLRPDFRASLRAPLPTPPHS